MNGERQERSDLKLGGQAVIEGVMIKGPRHAAVAVRTEQGELKITHREVAARKTGPFAWPLVRGLVVFWQTLAIGMWALDVSAREAAGGEEEEAVGGWMMAATFALAMALGAALFFWLPLILTQAAKRHLLPALASGLAFNLVDGIIRMAIFVLYILAISLMPGIRRVFEYHGAEHKVVAAFEHEGRLAPESFGRYSTLHPRCGTAFLLTVMVVSVLFFSLIPPGQPFWAKLAWRLLMLPLIAGFSFEVIRFTDRPAGRRFAWMLAPGLWLQKLTTGEPDAPQLEVAAAALNEVLRLDGIAHD
jgi:uncharacterized protein YqhQ